MSVETKRCTQCNVVKTVDGFSTSGYTLKSTGLPGWSSWCRLCSRTYMRLKYQNNPEVRISHAARYRNKTRDEYLIRKYGISEATYNLLNASQEGRCKICGQPPRTKRIKHLVVDHNHDTGEIRGLLCNNCNVALGYLDDNLERARDLVRYLEEAQL